MSMYRWVAIFFLLWTLIDLSVPQICMAEFDAPPSVPGASYKPLTASPQHDDESSNVPFQRDDDCFCCCSHVVPAFFTRGEMLNLVAYVSAAPDQIGSVGATASLLHPPRI